MKEEIYNEKELTALEEKIRAMGIPYSANEPDERYFANFRVRLMERIEAKQERKNILASVWSWLSLSPIRSLSLGAGLAAVVIAVLLIRPTPQPQVATVEQAPQEAVPVLPVAPQEIPQLTAPVTAKPVHKADKTYAASNKQNADKNLALKSRLNKIVNTAEDPEDLAMMRAAVSGGDSADPIDLESLSTPELESVLSAVESMK